MLGRILERLPGFAFCLSILVCLGMAAYQMVLRVPFPWDLYLWSESPFLTNMIKIDHGFSIYTPVEEVNSFVYSPGLEYLTFALLKPIGRQLDIRACRLVSIGIAVLGAMAFSRSSIVLARQSSSKPPGRWFPIMTGSIFFLIIYHNFTSDVPHPDNLHMCHLAITLLLTFKAIGRHSTCWSIAAVLFASLGVFVKQTAAFSAIGVAIGLIACAPRPSRAALWLIPLGFGATAGAISALWLISNAQFYTFEIVASHGIEKSKLSLLFFQLFQQYRLLPILLLMIALVSGFRSRNPGLKRYLIAHSAIGLFEAGPSVLAYLKPMGAWNNLGIIEVWSAVPFVPYLLSVYQTSTTDSDRDPESTTRVDFWKTASLLLPFTFLFCYIPVKVGPCTEQTRYCQNLDASIQNALFKNAHVLVAHGTSFLVHHRDCAVPLDRANSFLELSVAGKVDRSGTEKRIRDRYYDVIYMNTVWYHSSQSLITAIQENYQEIGRIPGRIDLNPSFGENGFQNLLVDVPIYVRRGEPALTKGPITDHQRF